MSDTVGMSFHIPRHIHRAFKIACAVRGVSMSPTIARMMGRYAENTLKQMEQTEDDSEGQPSPTTHTPPT